MTTQLQTVLDALERLAKRDNWKPFTPDAGFESDTWKPAEQYGLEAIAIVRGLMEAEPVGNFNRLSNKDWSCDHWEQVVPPHGAPLYAAPAAPQSVPSVCDEVLRLRSKLIECRSSVKNDANELDRFMLRKEPHANQCDRDEQKRLHDLRDYIDAEIAAAPAVEGGV